MRTIRDPIRLIPLLFAAAILIGTGLLWTPLATTGGVQPPLITAFFTSTSAVAVTGLIVVDTSSYWSGFGQAVILFLFQIGGFGIMASATLLGIMAGRGFGLRDRMATQVERDRLELGDAKSVLKLIVAVTIVAEVLVAIILTSRFATAYGFDFGSAAWHGVFHAVSAFNNAGFSTFSDSLMSYQSDSLILLPIMAAVIVTALGFPVIQEIRHCGFAFRKWTVHSKITVTATVTLLLLGFLAILAKEWDNPATLGDMSLSAKMLNALFHSAMPRTAGFNSLDLGAMRGETVMLNYILMFIGGGSAGTAGGIKITTFVILIAIVWAEITRQRDTALFGRRMGQAVERQALTIATLAASLITLAVMFILAVTNLPIRDVLFECISAFSTVGLSTGITASLPPSALIALCLLMFVGRVGTITVATALALGGAKQRPYRYPEETPIVG